MNDKGTPLKNDDCDAFCFGFCANGPKADDTTRRDDSDFELHQSTIQTKVFLHSTSVGI